PRDCSGTERPRARCVFDELARGRPAGLSADGSSNCVANFCYNQRRRKMSEEIKSSAAIGSETTEESSRGATVPVWLFIVLFLLFYWGASYFDESGGWFSPRVYTPYQSLAELQK